MMSPRIRRPNRIRSINNHIGMAIPVALELVLVCEGWVVAGLVSVGVVLGSVVVVLGSVVAGGVSVVCCMVSGGVTVTEGGVSVVVPVVVFGDIVSVMCGKTEVSSSIRTGPCGC
jgi:hypothetical protein